MLARAVGNWKMKSDSVGLEVNGKYKEMQPGKKTDELHKES